MSDSGHASGAAAAPIPESWEPSAGWPAGAGDAAVDVFRLAVPDEIDGHEWLSSDERERAARLVHTGPRNRFVAGRAALRGLLSKIVECPPGEVPLATGAHGKPEVPDAVSRGYAFNVSHTEQTVLVAVAPVQRIGIDVEPVREGVDFERLARRVLAESERRALPEGEAERRILFYRVWAAKEAYLKAWGTGLSFGASRCEMRIDGNEPLSLVASEMAGEDPSGWHFVELSAGEGLKACVCWPGEAHPIRAWQLDAEALPAHGA